MAESAPGPVLSARQRRVLLLLRRARVEGAGVARGGPRWLVSLGVSAVATAAAFLVARPLGLVAAGLFAGCLIRGLADSARSIRTLGLIVPLIDWRKVDLLLDPPADRRG